MPSNTIFNFRRDALASQSAPYRGLPRPQCREVGPSQDQVRPRTHHVHALADLLTLRDALAPSTLVHLIELSTAEEALGPSPPEVAFQALLAQPLGTKIGLMGWPIRVVPLLWIAVEGGYTDDGSGDNDWPDLSRQFVGHAAVASDAWQRDLGA